MTISTLFTLAEYNCHGWGQTPKTWSKAERTALVSVIRGLKASIYCLNECPSWMRDVIRDKMPGGRKQWLVLVRGTEYGQAILFDSSKWAYSPKTIGVVFGPTKYHGAIIADLTHKVTKQKLRVASYHLPPNSVSSQSYQKKAVAKMIKSVGTRGFRILAGDGADQSSWFVGYDDARVIAETSPNRNAPTYQDKKSKSVKDRVHVSRGTSKVVVRKYAVQSSAPSIASDHDPVVTHDTIPGAKKAVSTDV